MDAQEFRIPRQTDLSLIRALTAVRDEMAKQAQFVVRVCPHFGAEHLDVPDEKPYDAESIGYVLAQNSEVMSHLYLIETRGPRRTALSISRQPSAVTDLVHVHWNDWATQIPQEARSRTYVALMASAKRHLRAADTDASMDGGDSEWSRYRDAQRNVLSSLEETQKLLLVEFNRLRAKAEADGSEKLAKLEAELCTRHKSLDERLSGEHTEKLKALEQRETALKEKEESFNTKEARYVARQEQQNQIEQIQGWLEGWSLTKGTGRKRWPVVAGYSIGLLVCGSACIWFSVQSFDLLKSQKLAEIAWWQWALLSSKTILPLAAFTTFVVYFIQWTSSWARQHSDEEFRNRALVMDIARSRWILEAVRDAQDHQQQLPADLLKELSKNLFAGKATEGSDPQPQAIGDVLMQGLTSIRVKSTDGSEVEAKREKK